MRLLATPRDTALELERSRPLPAGHGERFSGYGALALPFASGELLAFRRFVSSSIGPPYSAVWHRSREARWTFYVDVEPGRSCPRYFGAQVERVVQTEIRSAWTGPCELGISLPGARLEVSLRLDASPATRLLNAATRSLPEPAWAARATLAMLGALASRVLGAGALRLTGLTPNEQRFRLAPRQVWRIVAGAAVAQGTELGRIGPLAAQAGLGEYLLPNAGLFAFGSGWFESCDQGGAAGAHAGLPRPLLRPA
jgi:hypothetical protein